MENDKRREVIPGTNPAWGKYLHEGDYNALTDASGVSWDNGYNYDDHEYKYDLAQKEEREGGAEGGQ